MSDEKKQPEQDPATGRFITGNIGGGRPRGARAKLGEAFLADLFADWQEHGPDAIERVRTERPQDYLRIIASITPKDLNVNINPLEGATDDELVARLKELASVVAPYFREEAEEEELEERYPSNARVI